MPTTLPRFDIEVDAPDGAAALELERRLAHLSPTTIGHGTHWIVEIPCAESPEELEVVVREWLEDLGEQSTTLRIDGRELRVSGRYAEHRAHHHATHADFIG